MAASATLALKAGVWFRRGLLLIVSPVRGYHRRYQAETPLIDLFKFASPALTASLAKSTCNARPDHTCGSKSGDFRPDCMQGWLPASRQNESDGPRLVNQQKT